MKKQFDSFDGGEIFCYMLDMLEEEKDSETAAVYIIAMMPILYDHLLEDEKEYAKSHPTLYS